MSIQCQICNQQFDNLISSTHLKKHSVTSQEYKNLYGKDSLASLEYKRRRSKQCSGENNPNYGKKHTEETKDKISKLKTGTIPWNKGIKIDDTTIYKAAAKNREQRYVSGELERITHNYTIETREKISKSVKDYAKNNRSELQERAAKSLETKIINGYDLAFFRGKTHTEEAKKKISLASKHNNKKKIADSIDKIHNNANSINMTVLNIDQSLNRVELLCSVCDNTCSFTRQYLTAIGKFKESLCPTCHPRETRTSLLEEEIRNWIASNIDSDMLTNNRSEFNGKYELDLYFPSRNLAIEVNGLYWHSEQVLGSVGQIKIKDYEKFKACEEKGIQLLTIYEDEWILNKEKVQGRLLSIFGKAARIYARKCKVIELDSRTTNKFLTEHHLQSSGRSNVRYGLVFNEELVSVMTFSRENISRKINEWEINRFCHKTGCTVVGGASKLFNAFIKDHNPERVISYSDNRWGLGNVYVNLGMELEHETAPNYWYFKPNEMVRYHRYSLRKNSNDDQTLTEWENRQQQGWNRIWDCGNKKWAYTSK